LPCIQENLKINDAVVRRFFFMKISERNKALKNFLIKKLKIHPRKFYIYELAFTHRSATIIDHENNIHNNERLEFLGDSILDAIISDYLCKKYPEFDEGKLTQTRSKMVNTNQLAFYAQKLNLDKFMIYSAENLNEKHLFADLFEALIGAIFIDKGFKRTYKFVVNIIINKYTDIEKLIRTEHNHKSRIIEYCQKKNIEFNFDTNITDNGIFLSKLILNGKQIAEGNGKTKKEAEQQASLNTLLKVFPNYNNGQ